MNNEQIKEALNQYKATAQQKGVAVVQDKTQDTGIDTSTLLAGGSVVLLVLLVVGTWALFNNS